MKKNMLFLSLIALFLVFPNLSVKALRPGEIRNRNICPNFELANARDDGLLDNGTCYDSYGEAKNAMYNTNNDNLVIIENGMIIDAKYAVIDYDINYSSDAGLNNLGYIKVYDNSTSSDYSGHYIRSTQPDDAVVLDYDYNTKRIKVKVAGLIGWIDKNYGIATLYDVVPLVWAKSPQKYIVSDNGITHVLPGNVYGDKGDYSITIDLKPTMLNNGTYYSYDGHYFYNDMKTMINDYKNNTYASSVNPNNPFYNYYQYLSFRTKTTYNADNLNQFINRGTGGSTSSKLYNTGESFINAQNNYGINAALMLAIGINESGWGNSNIAQSKNNLFGLGAVDSNPYLASGSFNTPGDCIDAFAYSWLSYGFIQPGDYRFKGANLGTKAEGLNYKYASDPFWAEKAAHNYFELDKMFDFQERKQNEYQIAVLNNNYSGVYAKKTPNGVDIDNETASNTSRFYKYEVMDSAVVILGEETDQNGVVWYKIQSDPTLTPNLSYTNADSKSNPRYNYNWNSQVYVSSQYFRKITDKVTSYPTENNSQSTTPPPPPTEKSVETIINNASYRTQNGFVSNIGLGFDTNKIINDIKNNGAVEVITMDVNGNPKSGRLATGDIIEIKTAREDKKFTIVISGDTSGDGEVSAVDYVRIKNHIMETSRLSGAYEKAADFNNDGGISASDYVKVKNYIMEQ